MKNGTPTLRGFFAATLVVFALVAAAYWVSAQYTRAAEWVSHTHEVLASLAGARADLVGVQNALRGYVITGRESDRETYRKSIAALNSEIDALRALTADNPAQQLRLKEFDEALKPRLASGQEIISARGSGGFTEAQKLIDTTVPAQQMDGMRAILDQLDREEDRLLQARLLANQTALSWFWWTISALVLALLVTLVVLYAQVRRRRVEQEQLLNSERRFHLMTQNIVDYAIPLLSPTGQVVSWNEGARRIKGYEEQEIVGQHFSRFYLPEDIERGKPDEELRIATANGRVEEEGWRLRKDGSRFWASVVITAVRDEKGALHGFGKVTRDLTERKRAEEAMLSEVRGRRRIDDELQELNASLERLVDERTAALQMSNSELVETKLRLQDLSTRLIAAQEEERRRISHELHDETGQALTGIKLRLNDMLQATEERRARKIEECVWIIDQAVKQIRNLAVSLRPLMLDDLGLAEALEWALDQQAVAAGWQASFDAGRLPERIPSEIETACFRIGQEALTNIARHAGAQHVDVWLAAAANELTLTVRDDGKGFDYGLTQSSEVRRQHFGLVSMTERANLAGGKFEVDTALGKGTQIRATFPLGLHH